MHQTFTRLIHADWSTTAAKRWLVEAHRSEMGWLVEAPRLVGSAEQFVDHLVEGSQSTLAGFDFPIGVPAVFGSRTDFSGFSEAIEHFGQGEWSKFYDVAEHAEDVSLKRPFYPRVSSSSASQVHLIAGLDVQDINLLRRQCERATPERRKACSLFWTLGANQVGKAAISGWREVVQPARSKGALLWPFDGELFSLANASKLVICETYPAEAYGHVGVRFPSSGSKQRQEDRRQASANLEKRCGNFGVKFTEAMTKTMADGFGMRKEGEDPFDAAMGLLGMIEVVEGRRAAIPASTETPHWEGWILGQVN